MAIIIDGRAVSEKIKKELHREAKILNQANGIEPTLNVILVGEDSASKVYVKSKAKAAKEIGIRSNTFCLPENTGQEKLVGLISKFNNDDKIHGILVQLPLPKHIDEQTIINSIDPAKDVDGFHPANIGALVSGHTRFAPCTPAGIMELLHYYNIPIDGKHCVVVGRSNIVGKPISYMLLAEHGTTTTCHSHTTNLSSLTKQADILVAAVGRPKLIKQDMIKPGAVLIDVGTNGLKDKIIGDIDFSGCQKKASAITPVPGGVGPMTVIMLMKNTIQAAKTKKTHR